MFPRKWFPKSPLRMIVPAIPVVIFLIFVILMGLIHE